MYRFLAPLLAVAYLVTAASAAAFDPSQPTSPFCDPHISVGYDSSGRLLVEQTVAYTAAKPVNLKLTLEVKRQVIDLRRGAFLLPHPKVAYEPIRYSHSLRFVRLVLHIPAATAALMRASQLQNPDQGFEVSANYDSSSPITSGFTRTTYVQLNLDAGKFRHLHPMGC